MKKIIWILRNEIPGSLDILIPPGNNFIIEGISTKEIANKLKREPGPALILLVIQKKEETDLKELKIIRKHNPFLPVIVIIFRHSSRCAEACANLSTQGYFVAPLEPSLVHDKIIEVLSERGKKNKDIAPMVRNTKVRKALEFIRENFDQPISVRNVADYLCLSINHFSKLFKKETGYNPISYINYFRISQAKRFLRDNPEADFMTVAEEIGFSDVYYFSRVFKQYTQQTPMHFRKSLKCIEMLALQKKPLNPFATQPNRFDRNGATDRTEKNGFYFIADTSMRIPENVW